MSAPKTKKIYLSKGLSIPEPLFKKVIRVAQKESRSFSYIVRRAIERELKEQYLDQLPAVEAVPVVNEDIIPITEVAPMLRLSISRIRTRSRKKGDPIKAARVRCGKQKPMHFHRSMIEELRVAS